MLKDKQQGKKSRVGKGDYTYRKTYEWDPELDTDWNPDELKFKLCKIMST